MEIVNEQVNDDGTIEVVVTGEIETLPTFFWPEAVQIGLRLRCAGHSWAVVNCQKPDPEGGIPIARMRLKGVTRPRRGMVLHRQDDVLTVGEVKGFVEALTHFYKIARSIDGERLTNAIQEYRIKHPEQSSDGVLLAFLRVATCAALTNASFNSQPMIEPAMADWETVATKINSLLSG